MGAQALDLAPFWLRMAAGFAAGALTWIVAADCGTALIARWVALPGWAARLGVGGAFGYALMGTAVGLLGLVGAIHPIVLEALLALAIAVRLPQHLRRLRSLPETWTRFRAAIAGIDPSGGLALGVLFLAGVTGIVNVALPAVWWDPIAYHLPIASAALTHGRFAFDPQMVQSGFPLLGEAAALPAYAIAGSAGAAMATLGAGLFVGFLVWALAECLCKGSGVVAAMLALSSALWAWLAPSFYVDVPFAMFVLAALLAALALCDRYGPSALDPHRRSGIAALAGALCGAAAAVKYSGLGAALVVAGWAAWSAQAGRWRVQAGFWAGFAIVAAGWYVRSFTLTGDPVYPFLSTLSRSPSVHDFAARYVAMTRDWCGGGASGLDLVALPFRLIADPKHFCGDPGLALRVGIVFAVGAMILVRPARSLAVTALALTLFWFETSRQWRFLLPALFIYSAIVAAGSFAVGERLRRASVAALSILGALAVLANWIPQLRSQASASITPAAAYIAGRQSAAQYLDERLESFAAARWLAERGIPGPEIVALDDVRDYYFPTGTAWANPYYQQALTIDWSVPASARYGSLKAIGKRYLVVNENEAYVHRTPTGVDWTVLAADRGRGLRQVYNQNGVSVYDMGGMR